MAMYIIFSIEYRLNMFLKNILAESLTCPRKEIPFLQVGDEFSKYANKYKKFDKNQVKNLVIEKKSTAGTAESYASGGVKVTDSLKREISELQRRKKPSTLGEGSSHILILNAK